MVSRSRGFERGENRYEVAAAWDKTKTVDLFLDASIEAFGVVAYLKEEVEETCYISFVMGKWKDAPVRAVSIPRFELLGACLAVRVAKKIVDALGLSMNEVIV